MSKEAEPIGLLMLEQVIGKRPRKPQTYELRKRLGKPEDIAFCKDYDRRIEEWEKKAEIERNRISKERAKDIENAKNFKVKEVPPIVPTYKNILADFLHHYKVLYGKDFNMKNPYSGTEEPQIYLATLICYFLKDERFFNSPLLVKDLSKPSFDKGTLTVGGIGTGKTSTWRSLLKTFEHFVNFCEKEKPKNLKYIKTNFDINQCVSNEVVKEYNQAKDKSVVLNPLYTTKQLYIDDIIREPLADYNFNVFLDVLTYRADRNRITHLSLNYVREFEQVIKNDVEVSVPIQDINKAIHQLEEKYDFRVWDRTFGHYNIIKLEGKSFRR